jgi:hypothetical protein
MTSLASQCNGEAIEQMTLVVRQSQKSGLIAPRGARVIGFPDGQSRLANAINSARQVLTLVERRAPTAAHLHPSFAGAVVRLLLRGRGRPGMLYCPHGWAFARRVHRQAMRRDDGREIALRPMRCNRLRG